MDEKEIYFKRVVKRSDGAIFTEEIGMEPLTSIDLIEKEDLFERYQTYLPSVFHMIREAKPEIENIFTYITENSRKPAELEGETFLETDKEAALIGYDKGEYHVLKREYFEDEEGYLFTRNARDGDPDPIHRKRDFIGKLCRIIISNRMPTILKDPTVNRRCFGVKPLYQNIYRQL